MLMRMMFEDESTDLCRRKIVSKNGYSLPGR